ncbi:MAG: hypothetical protein ACTSU6_03250 [Candidatus Njordarchaeales archaeon]
MIERLKQLSNEFDGLYIEITPENYAENGSLLMEMRPLNTIGIKVRLEEYTKKHNI